MNDQKDQIVEKLKQANNILVTVSRNPNIDQLAACIGLTLLLNKMNKHATAVFSGAVPSTIGFLKPTETIEKNTDSLRDFIVAIDKGKADKLRYKVEDEVVKIFITPYKSSISEKDLIFSQGDFNVDVVMALGVRQQQDLDDAITAHGRILHDAVVISVNNSAEGELGSINWHNPGASGLSEMLADLSGNLGENVLDNQIATALLTGIVAETAHFSNQKTTPQTMTASAALLAAGANQQLVAKELDSPAPAAKASAPENAAGGNGQLEIDHKQPANSTESKPEQTNKPSESDAKSSAIPVDSSLESLLKQADAELAGPSVIKLPEPKEQVIDAPVQPEPPKTASSIAPSAPSLSASPSLPPVQPLPGSEIEKGKTLAEIEEAVQSLHAAPATSAPEEDQTSEAQPQKEAPPAKNDSVAKSTDVDSARKAVEDALKDTSDEPLAAVGAVPVDLDLGHEQAADQPEQEQPPAGPAVSQPPQPAWGLNVPPPPSVSPTSTSLPPVGPPPPPPPPGFGNPQ